MVALTGIESVYRRCWRELNVLSLCVSVLAVTSILRQGRYGPLWWLTGHGKSITGPCWRNANEHCAGYGRLQRGRTSHLELASNNGGSRITHRTSRAAIANGTGTTRLRQCSLPHSAVSLRSSRDASLATSTSRVILCLLNHNLSSAGFTTVPPRRDFSRPMEQQNFTARPPMQQRSFTAPRQMEQRSFTPQPHNGGLGHGGEGRGHGR
jgi:hypothetical protein